MLFQLALRLRERITHSVSCCSLAVVRGAFCATLWSSRLVDHSTLEPPPFFLCPLSLPTASDVQGFHSTYQRRSVDSPADISHLCSKSASKSASKPASKPASKLDPIHGRSPSVVAILPRIQLRFRRRGLPHQPAPSRPRTNFCNIYA